MYLAKNGCLASMAHPTVYDLLGNNKTPQKGRPEVTIWWTSKSFRHSERLKKSFEQAKSDFLPIQNLITSFSPPSKSKISVPPKSGEHYFTNIFSTLSFVLF